MSTLQEGVVYPDATFSSFGDTTEDFLILQIVDGKPVATFQPKGLSFFVVIGKLPNRFSSIAARYNNGREQWWVHSNMTEPQKIILLFFHLFLRILRSIIL